ncbi:nucleolar protein 12-domain-containing protein [Cubamyces lactineus]|nr:nucleolar protein 12-domain-containing protein [Cubamyces lactineus]
MAPSNLAALTKSHNIVAAKKKAKREQIKEVVFNDQARREFLTGFHKRKLQKKEAAKQKAKEREKQERLEARREHRRMLAEQAAKNAEEAERAYGGIVDDDSDSEWDGLGESSDSKGKGKAAEEQEEYEDEEQLATVTVVEEFDPDSLIHGEKPSAHTHEPPNADDEVLQRASIPPRTKPKSAPSAEAKSRPDASRAKAKAKTATKAKDIKYQTSAARKAERTKQRKRKLEKAERAGGKSSRTKGGSKGKR